MKAVLLLLFVCCACVLACEGEMHMSSHMEMGKRSDPITTDYPWVFSVKPVEEMSRSSDPHTSQFAHVYTFCVPLQRTPVEGEDASASLELLFDPETEEIIVDFDSTHKFDYVNKDAIKSVTLSMISDSEFGYGWAANKKLSGKVYTTSPLVQVTLTGSGAWQETHDKDLLCVPQKSEQQKPEKPQSTGNDDEEKEDGFPVRKEHYPVLFLSIAFVIFFSIMMCCCTCSTVKIPEDEDVISEMEQFSPIPQEEDNTTRFVEEQPREQHVFIDEEEIMRKVQEESRRDYEAKCAQSNEFTVGAQREALAPYMKAPVMTPEAYATYLSSASPQ